MSAIVGFARTSGELSPPAQATLLRVLGEGEIVPVGGTQPKRVDVRVVAATSRDLVPMVESGAFRPDLYYRLRCLHVTVPPVRTRGNDWELIAGYHLDRLRTKRGWDKRLSADARALMGNYDWPGNVREVKSIIDTGFHLSDGELIEPRDFLEQLERIGRTEQLRRIPVVRDGAPGVSSMSGAFEQMLDHGATFWEAVREPYVAREMSRAEARLTVERGLAKTRGSYKRLVSLFDMPSTEYSKFMDFLRHQRLKADER